MEERTNDPANESSKNKGEHPAELQYIYLTKYFESLVKYTLIALGIVVAVGSFFFFKNISDIKEEQEKRVTLYERDAKSKVDYIIDSIKFNAKKIAINEAQLQVKQAFEENKISTMVENAAKEKIGVSLNAMVESEVNRYRYSLKQTFNQLSNLSDLASKARIGYRSSFEELVIISNKFEDSTISLIAKDHVNRLKKDYYSATKDLPKYYLSRHMQLYNTTDNWRSEDSVDISNLVLFIKKNQGLQSLAIAFQYLNEWVGTNIEMFDFLAVAKWWEKNKIKYIKIK